jgi:protein-tyrosine-phosphatase
LHELVYSDRAVWELTQLLNEPQSLVSYHLRQLRAGELVRVRRSSADGRDSYYMVDLRRCGELLQAAGGALHPGLGLQSVSSRRPWEGARSASARRTRILFLCTGNSARSQIAEALAVRMSGGTIQAASAGSNPKPLHPNAVRVMRRRGIDISKNRTKHLNEFVSQRFDFVITLCDRVREVCPEFPSHPNLVHWSVADPAVQGGTTGGTKGGTKGGTNRASYPAFETTATELETRIGFLLPLLTERSTTRRSARVTR